MGALFIGVVMAFPNGIAGIYQQISGRFRRAEHTKPGDDEPAAKTEAPSKPPSYADKKPNPDAIAGQYPNATS